MDYLTEEEVEDYYYYNNSNNSFEEIKPPFYLCLLTNIVSDTVSFLFSPLIFLISFLSVSYRKAVKTAEFVRSAVVGAPATADALSRRLARGFLGAAQALTVLIAVLCLAVVLGLGFVRVLIEEPVIVEHNLNFDFVEVNPIATFWFGNKKAIPVGHSFAVSVDILMPESDFNRHIGVFQISVQLLSTNGYVMRKSSLPCMLRFRSWPIRYLRTLITSVPLVLGLTSETQKITVHRIIKHYKEVYHPRTEAVRVSLIPRAGTNFLPQIYNAKIVIRSKLPWHREIIRKWKWTIRVWSSIYTFVLLVALLLSYRWSLFFPVLVISSSSVRDNRDCYGEVIEDESLRVEREAICIIDDDVEEEENSIIEAIDDYDGDDYDDDGDCGSVC